MNATFLAPPALSAVKMASLKCSPVVMALNNLGLALSTFLVQTMPCASTLPAPLPAPCGVDELWKAQLNESSSICFSNPSVWASPSTFASFSNRWTAI